jgi:hypothetical protein
MKSKVGAAALALTLATAFVAFQRCDAQEKRRACKDFRHLQPVEVMVGYNQGAEGMVMQVSVDNEGQCIYMVRGQRGVEMPFTEWYSAYELGEVTGE